MNRAVACITNLTLPARHAKYKLMNMQTCPYCKEKIYSNALVCRYCKRELPDPTRPRMRSMNWVPAVLATAIIVSGSAFIAYEFLKERRNWVDRG
jgi:uncharacterized paraquat-inducible protein A